MQYAVKAINLTDIQPQTLIRLRREIQVLSRAGLVLGAQFDHFWLPRLCLSPHASECAGPPVSQSQEHHKAVRDL